MLGAGMLGIVILVLATIQNTPTVEGIVPVRVGLSLCASLVVASAA